MQKKQVNKTLFAFIIICTLVTTFFMAMQTNPVSAAGENWCGSLSVWTKRMLLTIDQTYVDASLRYFPVLVNFSGNASLHTYAAANGADARFVSYYDNSTLYNYEIESWDDTGSAVNCNIWVNVTYVYASVDTKFWFYYGYAGASDAQNKAGTWDDSYVLVAHMNSSSSLYDSTNTHQVGTANSTLSTSGKIGSCQSFSAASKQCVNFTNHAELNVQGASGTNDFTVEVFHKPTPTNNGYAVSKDLNPGRGWYIGQISASHTGRLGLFEDSTGAVQLDQQNMTPAGLYNHDVWMHQMIVIDWNGSGATDVFNYLNGTIYNTLVLGSTLGHINPNIARGLFIGDHESHTVSYNGLIDEVRLSNVARNASYSKASYNTMNAPNTFLSAGVIEEQSSAPSVVTLYGPDSFSRINATGNNGATVWSNETYPGGTLRINISMNATTNCTDMNLWFGNLSYGENIIGRSNISIVFSSDNTTWGTAARAFTQTGTGNITINKATWTTGNGCYGTNPFNGTGLIGNMKDIYVRYKVTIPETAVNGDYTIDTLVVWWKGVS